MALFLLLPSLLHAEENARQEFSFLTGFLQMIAALAIVIGLILLTRYFSTRFIGSPLNPVISSRHIRVIEVRNLTPKKSLLLVEVGGEYLLISSTENTISLLKQVNVVEDIEVLDEKGLLRKGLPGFFRQKKSET